MPYAGSEPKSGWRNLWLPMLAIYWLEWGSTGNLEISWFQILSAGKMGHCPPAVAVGVLWRPVVAVAVE
jgi:hypothetical protein